MASGTVSARIRLGEEVDRALVTAGPVVCLETSVIGQGLPHPRNVECIERMAGAIRGAGAVPGWVGVLGGEVVVGLSETELDAFTEPGRADKVARRDLPAACVRGGLGATTVSATIWAAARAGVPLSATGGIGGVHREPQFDESADLAELARTPVVVVCAGAKSILDLNATTERLESLGVLVVGYRTREMPGFFFADTGIPVPHTVDSPDEVARLLALHRSLGRSQAIVVMQPPPAEHAVRKASIERALDTALDDAKRHGVRGGAVTPYLLTAVERATEGRTLSANLALLEANAALAAEIALAWSRNAEAVRVPTGRSSSPVSTASDSVSGQKG